MAVKFPISAFASIGVGLLIGVVIPVAKNGEATAKAETAPSTERTQARAAKGPQVEAGFEVPAEPTGEWAAACAATDPQAFLKWMLKQSPQPSGVMVEAFFSAWIEKDCDAAMTAALRLPKRFGYYYDQEHDDRFFVDALKKLYAQNPLGVLRWIGRVDSVLGTSASYHYHVDDLEVFRNVDMAEVARLVNETPAAHTKDAMVAVFGRALLAKRGLAEAVAFLKALEPEQQSSMLEVIGSTWGEQDPEAAMKFIEAMPTKPLYYQTTIVLYGIYEKDLVRALKWVEERSGVSASFGLCDLLGSFVRVDREAAQRYVMGMSSSRVKSGAMRQLGRNQSMDMKAPQVVEWIATLPADMQIDAARGAVEHDEKFQFADYMNPLVDGSLAEENHPQYLKLLTGSLSDAIKGEQQAESIKTWLKDHPGEVRDEFIAKGYEALKEWPQLQEKFLAILPKGEGKRLLGVEK